MLAMTASKSKVVSTDSDGQGGCMGALMIHHHGFRGRGRRVLRREGALAKRQPFLSYCRFWSTLLIYKKIYDHDGQAPPEGFGVTRSVQHGGSGVEWSGVE